MKDRQELIDKAKKQLDEFSGQLEELEKKMKDLSGEAKKFMMNRPGNCELWLVTPKRYLSGPRIPVRKPGKS